MARAHAHLSFQFLKQVTYKARLVSKDKEIDGTKKYASFCEQRVKRLEAQR